MMIKQPSQTVTDGFRWIRNMMLEHHYVMQPACHSSLCLPGKKMASCLQGKGRPDCCCLWQEQRELGGNWEPVQDHAICLGSTGPTHSNSLTAHSNTLNKCKFQKGYCWSVAVRTNREPFNILMTIYCQRLSTREHDFPSWKTPD